MNMSAIFIRRPVATALVTVAIGLGGSVAFALLLSIVAVGAAGADDSVACNPALRRIY